MLRDEERRVFPSAQEQLRNPPVDVSVKSLRARRAAHPLNIIAPDYAHPNVTRNGRGQIVARRTARKPRVRMSVKRIPSMTSQKLAVTRYCWPHERRTTTRIKNCNPSSVLATRWTRPTSLGRRFSASVHSREPGVAPSKSGDLLVGMASVGSRIPQTSEFFDGVQWVDVLCESPRIRPRTT